MDGSKRDYWRGLAYFALGALCVSAFFTAPDGDALLFKFLGLFGLSPGIPVGGGATLYIFPLLPLGLGFLSLRKVLKYWQGYGVRFRAFNPLMRFFPMTIAGVVLAFSGLVLSPSLVDRAYFVAVGRHSGLQAVTLYTQDTDIVWRIDGSRRMYDGHFTLTNHGNETLRFYAKLVIDHFDETIEIQDEHGHAREFVLHPGQQIWHVGEFTSVDDGGEGMIAAGRGGVSVVIFNEAETHQVPMLVRRPTI